jgi:hypothetical protein
MIACEGETIYRRVYPVFNASGRQELIAGVATPSMLGRTIADT